MLLSRRATPLNLTNWAPPLFKVSFRADGQTDTRTSVRDRKYPRERTGVGRSSRRRADSPEHGLLMRKNRSIDKVYDPLDDRFTPPPSHPLPSLPSVQNFNERCSVLAAGRIEGIPPNLLFRSPPKKNCNKLGVQVIFHKAATLNCHKSPPCQRRVFATLPPPQFRAIFTTMAQLIRGTFSGIAWIVSARGKIKRLRL